MSPTPAAKRSPPLSFHFYFYFYFYFLPQNHSVFNFAVHPNSSLQFSVFDTTDCYPDSESHAPCTVTCNIGINQINRFFIKNRIWHVLKEDLT
ncbi:hypothetical protein L1987_75354 [Smallanthus sonchifolius]|uniref:Uncharacterized protein n=1 Tax=Smallanthus sonchifolius TaxID=185202 RepID=A0ACB9A4Q2_9ASTR|nr:hypothetical protein L1987_75354 [Smallanthus sonchifolius]